MTNHIRRALEEINPCGIEDQQETHCKYIKECANLGRSEKGLICLSYSAYKTAGYILDGSDIETERKDLRKYLEGGVARGVKLVDPKKETWSPEKSNLSEIEDALIQITSRAQTMYQEAVNVGNMKDPLNFLAGADAIVRDLA
ncbi:MAG: hypothetical protein KJI69_06460 [Patescibacteria group bacterium]|nr:hypothetical protein [Patescibacteria group bacterium]